MRSTLHVKVIFCYNVRVETLLQSIASILSIANKYYKYRLMQRPGETNQVILAGRLFQEYVCVNLAKSQQQLFNYLEIN